MGRLLLAAACTLALQPLGALASPIPSPPLSGILAPAPSADYVESDPTVPGVFEGPFDATTYVAKTGSANATAIQQTLERDGFVDGYGRTWIQKVSRHVLLEYAMAFGDGAGAKKWLASAQLADKADPNYQHAISLTGIDAYYGAHFFYSSNQAYGDGFAFVKGNDFFTLIFVSSKDDLGNAAANQTEVQFDRAPAYTIPPVSASSSGDSFAHAVGFLIPSVLLLALVLGTVLFVIGRSRKRSSIATAGGLQLSADGRYWWDGQAWKDSVLEIPATAQRSADGRLWWDGRTWRPLPNPPS